MASAFWWSSSYLHKKGFVLESTPVRRFKFVLIAFKPRIELNELINNDQVNVSIIGKSRTIELEKPYKLAMPPGKKHEP